MQGPKVLTPDWNSYVVIRRQGNKEEKAKMEKGPDGFIIGQFADGTIECLDASNLMIDCYEAGVKKRKEEKAGAAAAKKKPAGAAEAAPNEEKKEEEPEAPAPAPLDWDLKQKEQVDKT